jgi:PDZ domain-containing protein
VAEKIVAARRQGATVFLVPRDNCAEARAHPPRGIRLVAVSKVSDALAYLEAKPGAPIPSC